MITEEQAKMLEMERAINARVVKCWTTEELVQRATESFPGTWGMPRGPDKTDLSHRSAIKGAAEVEVRQRLLELVPQGAGDLLKQAVEAVVIASHDRSLTRRELAQVAAQILGGELGECQHDSEHPYYSQTIWRCGVWTVRVGWDCNPGPSPDVWGLVRITLAPCSSLAKVRGGTLHQGRRLAHDKI